MELKPWASIFLILWRFLAFESNNAGTSVLAKLTLENSVGSKYYITVNSLQNIYKLILNTLGIA